MKITKKIITRLRFPYAIKLFKCWEGKRIFAASQVIDKCVMFTTEGGDIKTVLEKCGGTMDLHSINDKPDFLAIQGFYKDFNAEKSGIIKVLRNSDGSFTSERYIELPFVHRFCIVNIKGIRFILASTLCGNKDFKEDWSKPGMVYIGRLTDSLKEKCDLQPLIRNISKNHGMFVGTHNKKEVVIVTGTEGVFEINIPSDPNNDWRYRRILGKEVSDVSVFDIDSDGQDELIVIEKFHGDNMIIYKCFDNEYRPIFTYPISFGHVIWSGNVFGKPSIILGYRGANGALIKLSKKPGEDFYMDVNIIDENESPVNIEVLQEYKTFKVFSSSDKKERIVLYELRQH